MKFISILTLVLLSQSLTSQDEICRHADPSGATREKNIRPKDLTLDIRLYEKLGKVQGTATYLFDYLRPEVDTVFLDGIEMQVSAIKINDEAVKYRTDSAGVTIYLPTKRTPNSKLEIAYIAFPAKGMYFINWNNEDKKSYKQIWTQGQGVDNRHWIPGYDDVSNLQTVTNKITFNDQYPVVSNGDLISVRANENGTKTWTYQLRDPHALYLIMIAAGDYQVRSLMSKGGVKIDQYYYPDHEDCFAATYQHSESMMDWFENEIGVSYPWGKIYRNVPARDFLYGAMENTSSTIFADYMHQNSRTQIERAYLGVNAHELAHQWFGDLITERSPPHHWLHESFATHYSKKFLEHLKGTEEFDWIRKHELNAIFSAGANNSLPIAHSASGSPRHYPKGSFVLDMLRRELGNEHFRKSIQYYLTRHGHQNVETQDLSAAIYEVTGRNIDWFFDQWIYRGGEPMLQVDYLLQDRKIELYVQQVQKMEATVKAFRLPMKASIYYKSGVKQDVPIDIRKEKESFVLPLLSNETFDYVVLDENMDFLRKINYTKGNVYDKIILERNANALAKLEAVERLNNTSWQDKASLYLDVYHREKSPLVRKEIMSQVQIGTIVEETTKISKQDQAAIDILQHGLADPHHLVRRAAIAAMESPISTLKPLLIRALSDSSYINMEQSFQKLYAFYPESKSEWMNAIRGQEGINNNLSLVYYTKLLNGNADQKAAAVEGLKKLAGESSEYRARMPAIDILHSYKIVDEEITKQLIQGSFYFHNGIRQKSLQMLNMIRKDFPEIFSKVASKYPYYEIGRASW